MKVCVLTILDNLGNNGSLVQATAMLQVFKAEAVVWKRTAVWEKYRELASTETREYYDSLNIKRSFTDYKEAANYINKNYDVAIVGSDELWKAGSKDDMFAIPYPNPFWGSEIKIKKIALAVSIGSVNFSDYGNDILNAMRHDLAGFELIYVRDRHSQIELEKIGVKVDGIIPDPSFAIDFKLTDKLPDDNSNPLEWFSSFSNLDFLKHERMHKLLACLRGGTPCLSYDNRKKSIELREDFKLPEGSEEEIKRNWPYDHISRLCQDYRSQWISILNNLHLEYDIPIEQISEKIDVPNRPVIPASQTYMFDCYRTGRLRYGKGNLNVPSLVWKTEIPNSKPFSAESTAVFDRQGNMYFGCHDGNFFSLNSNGDIRWKFHTTLKIYSSPLHLPNSKLIYFASGDGFLYCLDFNGNLQWKQKIGTINEYWWRSRFLQYYKNKYHTLHEVNRFRTVNTWSSPNILSDGTILITGYGIGLSAFDPNNGKLKWRRKLGFLDFYLTGVAVTDKDTIIAVGQQGFVYHFSSSGELIWKARIRYGYNIWGNPSFDVKEKRIYVSTSRRESGSYVYAFDINGKKIWATKLPEGNRSTIAISREDYVVCCGFKGSLYFLNKQSGNIDKCIKATEGKMWTSASIDSKGFIYVSVIDSSKDDTGRVICYDKNGNFVWDYSMGKGHSVPVIDVDNKLYVGSWSGEYFCLQT